MSPEEFQRKTNVSRETLEKFKHFYEELVTWQAKINLIGPNTVKDIWLRHFYDSWQLIPALEANSPGFHNGKWLDLGSGAGFPGLVLAIMGVSDVTLVEANGKKCAFMRHISRELGLSVHVKQERIEQLQGVRFDYVTSRALSDLGALIEMSRPFVDSASEMWFFKGQDIEEELTNATISRNMVIEKYRSRSDDRGWLVRITGAVDETDVG